MAVDPILDGSAYDLSGYTIDPQRFVQYLYVKDNPLIYIDPLGEMEAILPNPETQTLIAVYGGIAYSMVKTTAVAIASFVGTPVFTTGVIVGAAALIVGTVVYYAVNYDWGDRKAEARANGVVETQ